MCPTPHRQYALAEWKQAKKTAVGFKGFWKGLDSDTKLVRVGSLGRLIVHLTSFQAKIEELVRFPYF